MAQQATRRVLGDLWDTTATTLGAVAAYSGLGGGGGSGSAGGMVDVTGGSNYTVDRVWPYAQRQHAQADVMLHRLQAWQAIIGGLTAYFDELAAVEAQYGRSQRRLASMIVTQGINYAPLARSLTSLHDYSEKVAAKHTSLGSALFEEPNRVLSQLKKCITQDVQKITAEIVRLQAALRFARQETLLAMAAYERAYWSTEASRDHATGDPWLTDTILRTKLAQLYTEEQAFNTAMISFHAELGKIDAFLMENAQVVLTTFSSWNGTLDTDLVDTNRAIGAQAAEIQPKVAFPSFAEALHLDNVDAWRQPIQALPYRYQNGALARVFKEGAALRQVGTVASSWRECYLVLTEGGFLHCYDMEPGCDIPTLLQHTPAVSVSVRHAAIETPQQGRAPPVYVLEVVPVASSAGYLASMGAHRPVLQLRSLQEMLDWVAALKLKGTEASAPQFQLDERDADMLDSDGELNEDFVLLSVAEQKRQVPKPGKQQLLDESHDRPPSYAVANGLGNSGVLAGDDLVAGALSGDDSDGDLVDGIGGGRGGGGEGKSGGDSHGHGRLGDSVGDGWEHARAPPAAAGAAGATAAAAAAPPRTNLLDSSVDVHGDTGAMHRPRQQTALVPTVVDAPRGEASVVLTESALMGSAHPDNGGMGWSDVGPLPADTDMFVSAVLPAAPAHTPARDAAAAAARTAPPARAPILASDLVELDDDDDDDM